MKKHLTVVSSCYNEEGNVREVYERVKKTIESLGEYSFDYIFLDNKSTDGTREVLRQMAAEHKNVKVILNARNFGQIRSPVYGLLNSNGDATILLVSDLQEPPELIADFVKKWEEGYKVVIGVKSQSEESPVLFFFRKAYYNLLAKMSDVELSRNFTGFGLYDKRVIETLRKINDPCPYFRGLVCDIGYQRAEIEYRQMNRKWGLTKNNLYTLYDYAMLGITDYSRVPLRIAAILGFSLSMLSLTAAFFYLVYKIIYWQKFSIGLAPVVIGLFFFSSVQLFFLGIIGEYIGSMHTKILGRPMVVEEERINF